MTVEDYVTRNLCVAIIEQAIEDYTRNFFSLKVADIRLCLEAKQFLYDGWCMVFLFNRAERRELMRKVNDRIYAGQYYKRGRGWKEWPKS